MSKTQIISKKLKSLENTKEFSPYLGRKVFSKSGVYIGKVTELVMQQYCMTGIMVKGSQNKNIFLDKEYFESDTEDAIMLLIDPVTLLIGKQVFDADGRKMGKVKALERKSNANVFDAIIVKKGIFSKPMAIPRSHVKEAKHNVLLNKTYDEEHNNK